MYETLLRPHQVDAAPPLTPIGVVSEKLKQAEARREEKRLRQIANARAGEERIVSAVLAADVPPELIVRELVEAGVAVLGFAVQKSSLEDRFVALTGEGFDVVR